MLSCALSRPAMMMRSPSCRFSGAASSARAEFRRVRDRAADRPPETYYEVAGPLHTDKQKVPRAELQAAYAAYQVVPWEQDHVYLSDSVSQQGVPKLGAMWTIAWVFEVDQQKKNFPLLI